MSSFIAGGGDLSGTCNDSSDCVGDTLTCGSGLHDHVVVGLFDAITNRSVCDSVDYYSNSAYGAMMPMP